MKNMKISVKLTAFEGPLDLLLHLIEKDKIDIYDIPISAITDQYLEYVRQLGEQDMELASEFMVMAATLLDIKCRMLLPSEEEPDEEEDPREELVNRLLEYKKYKYLSGILRDHMDMTGVSVTKPSSIPDEVIKYKPPVDLAELLGDVSADDLIAVYKEVARRQEEKIDQVRSRFGKIKKEPVTVSQQMQAVRKMAIRSRKISFAECLEAGAEKESIVVTFIAVLELMHFGKIRIFQEESFGEILIESLEDEDTAVTEDDFSTDEDY